MKDLIVQAIQDQTYALGQKLDDIIDQLAQLNAQVAIVIEETKETDDDGS